MNINREKAMEYLVDLLTGELSEEDGRELRAYVKEHPDIREEFDKLKRTWRDLESLDEKIGDELTKTPESMPEALHEELRQIDHTERRDESRSVHRPGSGENTDIGGTRYKQPGSSRPRIRIFAAAAAVLIAIVGGYFLFFSGSTEKQDATGLETIAVLEQTAPEMGITRNEKALAVEPGMKLKQGDRIRVSGNGECIVKYLNEETYLTFTKNARATINRQGGTRKVELDTGVLTGDVQTQAEGQKLIIVTKEGFAEVVGTKFSISSNGTTRLEVTDGKVRFESNQTGESVMVNTGEFIQVRKEMPLEVRELPEYKPENKPPIADAGQDIVVEDRDRDGNETITLNASGSTDPDGNIDSYSWSEDQKNLGTGRHIKVSLPVGKHKIFLTVMDDDGATDQDQIFVNVIMKSKESRNEGRPRVNYEKEIELPECDPQDPEVLILEPGDNLEKALNRKDKRIFCITPGDYRNQGGKWGLFIKTGGTRDKRRYLMYHNPNIPRDRHPWNMDDPEKKTGEKRVLLPRLNLRAPNWVIDRIRFDGAITVKEGSHNTLLNRLMIYKKPIDTSGNKPGRTIAVGIMNSNNVTIQNSVVGSTQSYDPNSVEKHPSLIGIQAGQSNNVHIVNNEIFDLYNGHGIITFNWGSGKDQIFGLVIQNNEIWLPDDFDSRPFQNAIDLRSGPANPDSSSVDGISKKKWALVEGNRIWNMSRADPDRSYPALEFHGATVSGVYVRDNIVWNMGNEYSFRILDVNKKKNSFVVTDNLFYRARGGFIHQSADRSLYRRNILVDVKDAWRWKKGAKNNEITHNVFINSNIDALQRTGEGNTVSANAYYASKPFQGKNANGIIRKTVSAARHENRTFQVREITGPKTITIPYGKISSRSPHLRWFK